MRTVQRFAGRLIKQISFKWIEWRERERSRQKNGLSHFCTNSSSANTLESVVSNGDSESVSYSYQPAAHQLYKWSCEQVEDGGFLVSCLQYVFLEHTKCSFSAFPLSAVISKTCCPPIRSRVTWKCVYVCGWMHPFGLSNGGTCIPDTYHLKIFAAHIRISHQTLRSGYRTTFA